MLYLDNAATTFPKPLAVPEAMSKCMLVAGGNPGRGAHAMSLAAAKIVYECRESAAEMFGAADSDRVFFTQNTTHGLNTVLKGILREGDHVLISDMEHNAVWRPIYKLASEGKIEYDIFPTQTGRGECGGDEICAGIERLLRPNTRAVVCIHTPNICSATLPVGAIGELCKRHGIALVVDGAQSAGHIPIDVEKMNISALCLPAHKGLYGPQGSGLVVLGEGLVLDTLCEGGNGIESLSPEMSLTAPERYEAGTLAVPNIAGLGEGLNFVRRRGVEYISQYEEYLCKRATELLGNISGVELYLPEYSGSTVLFNIAGVPSEQLADALNFAGICVRAGYHCAALAHYTLRTPEGGAVRMSFSVFNTAAEIEKAARLICNLAAVKGAGDMGALSQTPFQELFPKKPLENPQKT